jgi:hypothetical protein
MSAQSYITASYRTVRTSRDRLSLCSCVLFCSGACWLLHAVPHNRGAVPQGSVQRRGRRRCSLHIMSDRRNHTKRGFYVSCKLHSWVYKLTTASNCKLFERLCPHPHAGMKEEVCASHDSSPCTHAVRHIQHVCALYITCHSTSDTTLSALPLPCSVGGWLLCCCTQQWYHHRSPAVSAEILLSWWPAARRCKPSAAHCAGHHTAVVPHWTVDASARRNSSPRLL